MKIDRIPIDRAKSQMELTRRQPNNYGGKGREEYRRAMKEVIEAREGIAIRLTFGTQEAAQRANAALSNRLKGLPVQKVRRGTVIFIWKLEND